MVSDKQAVRRIMNSFYGSRDTDLPRSVDESRAVIRNGYAYNYQKELLSGGVGSKKEYTRRHHISVNTLNKGLREAGMMANSKSKRTVDKTTAVSRTIQSKRELKGGVQDNTAPLRTVEHPRKALVVKTNEIITENDDINFHGKVVAGLYEEIFE